MTGRRLEAALAGTAVRLCALAVAAVLAAILAVIVAKGWGALSWAMVSEPPRGGFYLGGGGGLLNAIVGSLLVAGGATLAAFCFALPIAAYLQPGYLGGRRLAELVRLVFDILFGVPSIVYGALGFALLLAAAGLGAGLESWAAELGPGIVAGAARGAGAVLRALNGSLAGGILVVGLLELPILVRGMDETLRMVPRPLTESSLALGATRLETLFRVGLRQSLPGIITAVIVAFGRGIGDAASVLFTAGFSDRVPDSLLAPAPTLPLAIFFQLGSPFAVVRDRAYAAAIILLVLVVGLSLLARLLAARLSRNVVR